MKAITPTYVGTYCELCNVWNFRDGRKRFGSEKIRMFKQVKEVEKKVQENPNSYACLGTSFSHCNRYCAIHEFCRSLDCERIVGAVVILEES